MTARSEQGERLVDEVERLRGRVADLEEAGIAMFGWLRTAVFIAPTDIRPDVNPVLQKWAELVPVTYDADERRAHVAPSPSPAEGSRGDTEGVDGRG